MPINAPFNPQAALQPGITDLGSEAAPYRSQFLTDKVQITEEDTTLLDADLGIGAVNAVGRNDGGIQFNGISNLSAYDGNSAYYQISRTNAADLSPSVALTQGDIIAEIIPYGADGSNYVPNGEILFEVDAPVAAGDVPIKLGLITGAGVFAFARQLLLRSSGILEFVSNVNVPKSTSRQFTSNDLTTNATPSSATSFALEDETVYHFRSAVKGRFRDTATDKGVVGFLEFSAYRNNGGNAVLVSPPFKGIQDIGVASGYDFNPIVSGNDVLIEVTGALGEVVDWTVDTVWSGAGS